MTAPDPIILPEDLRGPTVVPELLETLRQFPEDTPLSIDASAVETMNTSAVVVFLAALNSRSAQKPPITVLKPSDAFVDAFSELGLFQNLMKMEFRT